MKNNNMKTKIIAAMLAAISTVSTLGTLYATSASAAEVTAVTEQATESPEELAQDIQTAEEERKKAQETTVPAATAAKVEKTEKEKEQEKKAREEEARKEKENKEINERAAREKMLVEAALGATEDLLKTYIGEAYKKIAGKSELAKILKKKGDGVVGKLNDSKKDHKLSREGQMILESVTKLENLMSDNQEKTVRGIDAIMDAIKNSHFRSVYGDLENDYNNSLKQVAFIAGQLGNLRAGYQTKESLANIKARLSTHDPHQMCRLFGNFYTELNKETVTVNGEKHSAALEQYIKNRFSDVRRKDDHTFSADSADYSRVRQEINGELELMAQLCINDYYVIKLYLQAYKEIVGVTDTVQTKAALDAIEQGLDRDFEGMISWLDRSYLNADIIKAEVTVDGLTKGYLNFADAYSTAYSADSAVIKLSGDVTAEKNKGLNVNGVSAAKGFNGANGLLVNNNKTLTIDFGGKTVDCEKMEGTVFTVAPSCKLTLKNGTFKNVDALLTYRSDKAVSTQIAMENIKVVNSKKSAVQLSDKSKNARFTFEKCTFENVKNGAGIYSDYTDPAAIKINGCTFINCNNSGNGGAVSLDACNERKAYFTVTNCVFKNNTSKAWGGALYYTDAKNCEFIGNKAKQGGAVCNSRSLIDCTFENNSSTLIGGAALNVEKLIKNCTFKNNKATDGGAIHTYYGIKLEKVTMSGNRADNWGGGAFLGNTATVIDGLTALGNKAGKYGGALALAPCSTGKYTLKDSILSNNQAGIEGGAVYCNAAFIGAADVKLDGSVMVTGNEAGKDNKEDGIFLENATFTKCKLYTADSFCNTSRVKVSSNAKGETAVCELANKAQSKAFSTAQNRTLQTGSFYDKTVYLGSY